MKYTHVSSLIALCVVVFQVQRGRTTLCEGPNRQGMCIQALCAEHCAWSKQHEVAIRSTRGTQRHCVARLAKHQSCLDLLVGAASLYVAGSCLVSIRTCAVRVHTHAPRYRSTSRQKAPPPSKKHHVSAKSTTSYDTDTTFQNAHYLSNHTTSQTTLPLKPHHLSIKNTTPCEKTLHHT